MPRQSVYDHPRRVKTPSNGKLAGLIGLGFLCTAIAISGLSYAYSKIESAIAKKAESKSVAKVYTREEFRALVLGKTPKELIELLGQPFYHTDYPTGEPELWVYGERAMNPNIGKPGTAYIDFEDGKAVRVRW